MATMTKLLKLAAKVALDFVVAPGRVDEAAAIFDEWVKPRDAATIESELAKAEREAQDPNELGQAMEEAIGASKADITAEQKKAIALSVELGLAALRGRDTGKALDFKEFKDAVFPGGTKTFIAWFDHPAICQGQPGRYCHINWDGDTFRVRDYIGGKIYHPPGKTGGGGLTPAPLDLTIHDLWQAGKGPVQCLNRYGLNLSVDKDNQERWRKILTLVTQVAAVSPGVKSSATTES
jgi:hypothetical protein